MQTNKFTKILRKNQTPEERKLWFYLKNNNLNNFKFRRQVVIDKFIVDFCCFKKRLIIELDGGQHNATQKMIMDHQRDKYLKQNGFQILRIWNNDITNNFNGVLEKIIDRLQTPSSGCQPPSPVKGRR
jgi:very-short-patch-repair endonuclease